MVDLEAIRRNNMVDEQLLPRGISNEKVIAAFRKVPRHEFVHGPYLGSAYEDHPLPIGSGQTISQPYMVALMTECLRLEGGEKVLEVGTGSGYQLAILLEVVNEAYSVERVEALALRAEESLQRLGYEKFMIRVGDGTLGWEEHAPYDGIIVTAAAPRVPEALLGQLKDGGRLVIPVGGAFGQTLEIIRRKARSFVTEEVCGCVFVPLIGQEGWRE